MPFARLRWRNTSPGISAAPMLALRLFARPGFAAAVLFGVPLNFAYYGVLFAPACHLRAPRLFPPPQSGLMFLPPTATFVAANLAGGWMAARAGHASAPPKAMANPQRLLLCQLAQADAA
jgi:hypothetical protein